MVFKILKANLVYWYLYGIYFSRPDGFLTLSGHTARIVTFAWLLCAAFQGKRSEKAEKAERKKQTGEN